MSIVSTVNNAPAGVSVGNAANASNSTPTLQVVSATSQIPSATMELQQHQDSIQVPLGIEVLAAASNTNSCIGTPTTLQLNCRGTVSAVSSPVTTPAAENNNVDVTIGWQQVVSQGMDDDGMNNNNNNNNNTNSGMNGNNNNNSSTIPVSATTTALTSTSAILTVAKNVNSFSLKGHDKECIPLVVDGYRVGLITKNIINQIKIDIENRNCPFVINNDDNNNQNKICVEFNPKLVTETYEARSEAIAKLLQQWKQNDYFVALKGWRNECFDVSCHFDHPSVFKMERAATFLFGIRKYGVDINGFVRHPIHGICIWLQKRAATKQTWPGYWDNMVGGGLSVGYTVNETAVKEAQEEASIPTELLKNLKAAGTVSYFFHNERGLSPNTEFVFDLELPIDFKPVNSDGEVDEFNLVSAEEALRVACGSTFKTTSCPVILDFMIREGLITESTEPNLMEVKKLLNVPLEEFYFREPKSDDGRGEK